MDESIVQSPTITPSVSGRLPARGRSTWRNLLQYLMQRLTMLALTVITAVYVTIIIANYGGYVDTIVASRIRESVGMSMAGGLFSDLPLEERMMRADETIAAMEEAAGLNDPFLLRTAQWLGDGLLLNWGQPTRWRSYGMNASETTVAGVILSNLSRTLLMFGLANVLLFVVSVLIGLFLSRRRGGLLDRLFILLSPISSAPAWVYGVLLSVFMLRVFGFSPGGTFDSLGTSDGLRLVHIRVLLRHLTLPFLAIFLAGLFQTVYTWRSFFQVYSDEDYVEMARARGLSKRRIDRDYIIRPALPGLLTRFGLLLALLWQEVIALEYFFNVQGLGRLFVNALESFDTPMIVAIVTVFAYLIAITVFVLDLCYIVVDPRVRAGKPHNGADAASVAARKGRRWRLSRRNLPGFSLPIRTNRPRPSLRVLSAQLRSGAGRIAALAGALRRSPSAIFGLVIIALLIAVSAYTVLTIPYEQAIILWRSENEIWLRNPHNALPVWVNFLRRDDLPPTLNFDSSSENIDKEVVALERGLTDVTIPFTFEYNYGDFPQELVFDIQAPYDERGPHVTLTLLRPDGSEQELAGFKPNNVDVYYLSRDERLKRRLDSERPLQALFLDPGDPRRGIMQGTYTLRVNALLFEPGTGIDVKMTLMGKVHGLAGTDAHGRDLMIALLWGTPVALGFGLVAAFATSVGGMLFAALGAWYGGITDRIVQFLTETTLILPFFPVSLMVFVMYSRNILTILTVVVALTIFGSAVKTYRAIFLQVRTEPYIEAAQAYGASDRRIVARYMVPRIVALLIPRLIILVPGYVFLEATLAFLGVSDPVLPTWGKLVVAALSSGIHSGATHVVLAPLTVLFITGFAFAMVGLALERISESRITGI